MATALHRRVLLLPLVLAVLLGCGARRTSAGPAAEPATLEVENQAFVDMTVYVVEGGSRRRIGFATAASTTQFTIPPSVVGLGRELQFIVDPIGSSRTSVSNRLYVVPGQQVRLVIPPR